MNLETLATLINEGFGSPFHPRGFVTARLLRDDRLEIGIGDREIVFNSKGELTDSGTNVGSGRKWVMTRRYGTYEHISADQRKH